MFGLRQRRRAFDETLPDGTPAIAIGLPESIKRILRQSVLPHSADVNAGEGVALSDPPPVIRTAEIPVTDSLPIEANPHDAPSPLTKRLLDASRMMPVEAASVIAEPVIAPTVNLPPLPPGTNVLNEPAPVMVEGGQRPVRRNTGDALADEQDYRNQLERYRPANHNSRLAGMGAGGMRGFRKGGILGGIIGLIRGGLDKTADEEDARAEALPQSNNIIQRLLGERKAQIDMDSDTVLNEQRRASLDPEKVARENLLKVYLDLPEFDPDSSDPAVQQMNADAKRLKVALPKKLRGEKYVLAAAGDRLVKMETSSGKTEDVGSNVKTPALGAKDLPDTLFGIPDEDTIEAQARSSVGVGRRVDPGKAAKNATVRRQIEEAKIRQKHAAAVGDEALVNNVIKEIGELERQIEPEEVDESPAERDRRIAAAKAVERQKYEPVRKAANEFRLRVSRHKPTKPNPQTVPVTNLVNRFNEIMALPPKERDEALKTFYAAFDYLQIQ